MRCAVIGAGNMGKNHARNYFSMKEISLVAVADINPKPGEALAKKYHCSFYQDYRLMLANEKIDVVNVVTPSETHFMVGIDCLKARKHILIEKPIAVTIKEAKQLIQTAKLYQKKLTVGHVERFNPAVRKLKEMINDGEFGIIKSILFQRVGLLSSYPRNTNVIVDIGIHDIDIANFLLVSLPKKIVSIGGKTKNHFQEDYADILLGYKDAIVQIQTNWVTPVKVRRLMIAGTKGYAELDYIKQTLNFYPSQSLYPYDNFGKFIDREKKKIRIKIKKKEPLREELQSFIEAIKKNQSPGVTGNDGLEALRVALTASSQIKKYEKIIGH